MFYRLMLVVLLILFFPSFARTQSVPLPNIDGWNMEKLPIDIKVSDSVVAYIGFELKYQNPTDPNEFVMVIMRSIPAVVARNESEDIRSFKQTLVESYTQKDEQDIINFAYACVVSIATIRKGERFTKKNLWVKRPGTGEIRAVEYKRMLGKKAARDVQKDVHLRRRDVA